MDVKVPSNLEIKQSAIHGLGVFAVGSIRSNQILSEWIGIPMLKTDFKKIYGNDTRYTYWSLHNFKNTKVIVAKNPRNFITYINESLNPNVYLKNKKLYTSREINQGEELFLRYDKDYKRDYIL